MKRASVTFNVVDLKLSVSSEGDFIQIVDVPADPVLQVGNVGDISLTFRYVNPDEPIEDEAEPILLAMRGPNDSPRDWYTLTPSGVYGDFRWQQDDRGVVLTFSTSPGRWVRDFRLAFASSSTVDGQRTQKIVVIDPKIYNDGRDAGVERRRRRTRKAAPLK